MLVQLIYASTATQPFSDEDLANLLWKAREKNRHNGITGMLVYRDSTFLQVLEGEEPAIDAVWDIIAADSRHDNLVVIRRAPLEAREFPDWSMGFCHAAEMDWSPLPGYNGLFDTDFSPAALVVKPGQARSLLLSMKTADWPETPAGRYTSGE